VAEVLDPASLPEEPLPSQSALAHSTEERRDLSMLMGGDVEARRKFIEDNALDVKNLEV